MAINVPVIVSVVEVGSPTAYLRVTWDHDITGSPATDGYLIEWDYDNPAWNPSWVIPPAVDLGLLPGDGKSPVRRYSVLINLSNAFVSDWETFEEYGVGNHSVLSYGGSKWAGPAVAIETDIGYKGFGDDFESYTVGQHSELGGGKGWASPAEAIGMGDFDIVMRTIGGVDDQRVVVDNTKSPWVRTMAIGDDWTKLRIGIRIGTRRNSSWSNAPLMYFGLTSGSVNIPGMTSIGHFFGVRTNDREWTVMSNSPTGMYMSFNLSSIGNDSETTATYGPQSSSTSRPAALDCSLGQAFIIFDITKGSPWVFESAWTSGHNSYVSSRNCTVERFYEMMNTPSIPSGSNIANNSSSSFTPDEGTYGALDTICFSFLGSTDGFEISDIAYARLA